MNEFIEWTNTKPDIPQYDGLYQLHVSDYYVGYCNLLVGNTQTKQVEPAKNYSVEVS